MDIKPVDLIKIIEMCGKTGVSNLKIGEVEICFNGFVIQTEKDYPKMADLTDRVTTVDPNFSLQERVEKEDTDAELLMITDPAEYERLYLEGKLEDSEGLDTE